MNEQSIFLQALEQPAGEERNKWLDEACGGDSTLKARIDALLKRHEQAGSFLEKPPAGVEATLLVDAAGENRAAALDAGLASAFSDGEAVLMGDADHSVLKALSQTMDVPRVALRESKAEGSDPITRPGSREMPVPNSDSRYRLDGEIARGGMGAIIKGRDTDLGRDLAIKVLLDEHKTKPEVIQRFVEEAQIGGQLQHPGIAPVYDVGQLPDRRPFFSMKLVKGETLSKLLADRKDQANDRAKFLGIFEQICQTMAYAHSRGVIHRDLKPANIMVGAFGEVQVMDWGLAKVLSTGGVADEKKAHDTQMGKSIIQTLRSGVGSDTPGNVGTHGSQTQMGSVMGTPAYMPPEQALGEIDNLDERADVFGLGSILCEILTGRPPYVAENGTQLYRMASRGKLQDCFERLDDCGADAELIALTKYCLELEPVDRPRDAGVLAEHVTGYLESVETKLRQAELDRAAEATRVVEQKKRLRVTLALAASVMVIVLGGGGVAWWQTEQENDRRLAEERSATEMARLEGQQQAERVRQQAAESARHTRNADAVAGLLTQADEALRAGDAAKARVALEAAQKRSAEGGAETHAERLARREADLVLLSDLDAVDQFRWTYVKNRFVSPKTIATRTRDALRRFGVDPDTVSVDDAEARARTSLLMPRIVAALDRLLGREKLSRVRSLLRRLDANPFRDEIRDAVLANDWATMAKLADQKDALTQPPTFTAFLGEIRAIPVERRRELLSIAVSRRPGDLGLLMTLGISYPMNQVDGVNHRLRWLQAAVAAAPNNPGAHNQLGIALYDKRDPDGAIASYRKAIELDPKDARPRNNLGNALRKKGDLSGAIASYRKAIELDPKRGFIHNNLGIALHDKRDPDGAIASFRKAIEVNPKFINAHYHLGIALAGKGDLDRAIASYRKAIEVDPKFIDAHYNLGIALAGKGDLGTAIASYRKAIEVAPKFIKAHYKLGQALDKTGDRDGAVKSFRKAIEFDPRYTDAYVSLGAILCDKKKDYDGAIACFRKAIDLDPALITAHFNLGIALMKNRDLDRAIASYRKAIELAPKRPTVHYTLGLALRKKGDLDEAISSFRKAIELAPKNAQYHFQLGSALHDKRDLDGAIASFRKAIEHDPRYTDAYVSLGAILFDKKKDYDGAIACFRKAIDLYPKHASFHDNLGIALRKKGDLDGVITEYRKAIEIEPKNAKYHYNLGNALLQKTKFDEAIDSYKEAIKLAPNYAEAHCNMGSALMAQGRFAKALAAIQRGHELGTKQRGWRFPSAKGLKEAKQKAALESKLTAILKGESRPSDNEERLALAQICKVKKMYRAATEFYADAFAADAKLADNLKAGHRYVAARSAIHAVAGTGVGEQSLDDAAKARFRSLALEWLKADRALWTKRLQSGKSADRRLVQSVMLHWQKDPALAGIRDKDALAKLPADERKAFEQFWSDVAALLKKVQQ